MCKLFSQIGSGIEHNDIRLKSLLGMNTNKYFLVFINLVPIKSIFAQYLLNEASEDKIEEN